MTTVTQMKAETTIGHFFFQLQRNTLGIIQLFPKSNLLLVLETKQSLQEEGVISCVDANNGSSKMRTQDTLLDLACGYNW